MTLYPEVPKIHGHPLLQEMERILQCYYCLSSNQQQRFCCCHSNQYFLRTYFTSATLLRQHLKSGNQFTGEAPEFKCMKVNYWLRSYSRWEIELQNPASNWWDSVTRKLIPLHTTDKSWLTRFSLKFSNIISHAVEVWIQILIWGLS